jgi:hemoglobin
MLNISALIPFMDRPIYVPQMRPGDIRPPSKAIYAQMGEENVRQMMRDFYQQLGSSPIMHMFPKDLETASQKSADFFIGLLGGPALYHQKHGNPMMRARHMPFAINVTARQVWLDCFEAVLVDAEEKYQFPADDLPGFLEFLHGFSMWMVNSVE